MFLHGFTFLHKNYITKTKNTQNQSKQKHTSNQENNIKQKKTTKKNTEMNQQQKLWEVQGVDSSSQFFFGEYVFDCVLLEKTMCEKLLKSTFSVPVCLIIPLLYPGESPDAGRMPPLLWDYPMP